MMKIFRTIPLLLAALMISLTVCADERSAQLLAALERRVESMAGYEVHFTLRIQGREMAGSYCVQGESYHMQLGEAEVYSDGQTRSEVDPTKREVVIDRVDPSSHNILQNPTRAFTFLDEDFNHALRSEAAGRATLTLSPKSRSSFSAVTLVVEVATATPQLLIYEADGEQLQITITSFKSSNRAIPLFDPKGYPDYELIDFR